MLDRSCVVTLVSHFLITSLLAKYSWIIMIAASTPIYSAAEEKSRGEALLDIDSLDDLKELMSDTTSTSWTEDDVLAIMRPLIGKPPDEWPIMASKRVELLDRNPIDCLDFKDSGLKSCIEVDLAAYNEMYRYPPPNCLRRDFPCIDVGDLFEFIQQLQHVPPVDWDKSVVDGLVEALAGRSEINCVGAQEDAVSAWYDFVPIWEPYVHAHPNIARKLDPYYVIIDVLGVQVPHGLDEAISSYPPPGSSAPALSPGLNDNAYIRPFMNVGDARQFVGWIQARVPGLRVWMTTENITPPSRF